MNFRSLTGAPLVLFASLGIATSASAGDDRGASGRGDDTSLLERANKKEADGEPVAQAGSQQRPQGQPQGSPTGQGGPPAGAPAGAGPPFGGGKPVFDETWASIGIGAGLVPSYSGSDDYTFFPLPLIVGRVGGIGISPNGPGFVLDLNSAAPSMGPRSTSVSFGPAFRIRNDRVAQIEDEVVEQLEDLDLAIEVGGNVGVSIPGILNQFDSVRLSTQVRWDIAGAHDGMLIEPSIGYTTPMGRGMLIQVSASAQFVDDSFADYYYSISAGDSAITGLPTFQADGGLNSLGTTMILNIDLDNNSLNGGFGVYVIGGYSRLVGDGADTPFTAQRGDANQFIGGVGIGYTF